MFGRFDAVAIIEATDLEELKKIIYEMIEQHPDVIHTETLLSMNSNPIKERLKSFLLQIKKSMTGFI